VGLELGPLSLVSTNEELLERKSSGSSLETEITAIGDPLRCPCDTPLFAKVALTWLTSGSCSFGIVLSWTKATELYKYF
jgi:hypothetical protein